MTDASPDAVHRRDTAFIGHPTGLAWLTVAEMFERFSASSVIGLYFLNNFAANLAVGWLGGFYETMTPTAFWLMHAGIMGAAVVLLIGVKLAVGPYLAPAYDAPGCLKPLVFSGSLHPNYPTSVILLPGYLRPHLK